MESVNDFMTTTLTINPQSTGLFSTNAYFNSSDGTISWSSGIYVPNLSYTITHQLQGTVGQTLMANESKFFAQLTALGVNYTISDYNGVFYDYNSNIVT